MYEENILFFLTGNKLIFENGKYIETEEIESGKIYVDLNTEQLISAEGLKERKRLAINGAVVVVNSADKAENINENNIIIELKGFEIKQEYLDILKQSLIDYNQINNGEKIIKEDFKEYAENTVKKFFKKRFSRRPLINIINTKMEQ